MNRSTHAPTLPAPRDRVKSSAERRATPRTPVNRVVCDAGGIIDISIRGMRVLAAKAWSVGQVKQLTISDGPHHVTLPARCVWATQESDKRFMLGLAFDDVAPEHEGMLLRLSMEHAEG